MFNNPQGLIPLSHELLTAQRFTQNGSRVEFVELGEEDRYDFRVSTAGVTVQLDCKSVSQDNGLFFDSRTGSSVYQAVGTLIKQQPSVFNGKIVHIQVLDRDRAKFNLGIEIRKALYSAINEGSEGSTRFQCSLVPFPDALMQELQAITTLGHEVYMQKGMELVANHVGDLLPEQVEGVYLAPVCAMRSFRTALILSSFRPRDWKANVVEAIKESLEGQLRDQIAPVVCVRFNNLSDKQRGMIFWAESSHREDLGTTILSPSDSILWEIARSRVSYRDRLCALMIVNRPSWSRTSIRDQNGNPIYQQDRYWKNIYLPGNPVGFRLRAITDHWA